MTKSSVSAVNHAKSDRLEEGRDGIPAPKISSLYELDRKAILYPGKVCLKFYSRLAF